jgi:hypothetical protein
MAVHSRIVWAQVTALKPIVLAECRQQERVIGFPASPTR